MQAIDQNNGVERSGKTRPANASGPSDIAIIGMSGRFPGASNTDSFWNNLIKGRKNIMTVPKDRWDWRPIYDSTAGRAGTSYSNRGGFIEDIDAFDADFFGIYPNEAESMDPQQRLALEEAYRAIEDAGYGPLAFDGGQVGVFVGVRTGDYHDRIPKNCEHITPQVLMGNDTSVLAGRISHALDLKGINMSVNTACSSMGVAIHNACRSISLGESRMALAGAVYLMATPQRFLLHSRTRLMSKDAVCRPFDEDANGFVLGEAVGFVVLKALSAALLDGDTILGVIKSTGVNHDGRTRGLAIPNPAAMRELIAGVIDRSGIDPATISYIEAHGTGTRKGDANEVKTLSEVFARHTDRKNYCALGSVKANVGYAIVASLVPGLFKVLLAFKNQLLPPMPHFQRGNTLIDWDDTPFYVNDTPQPWPANPDQPRRSAISAISYSGTNFHMVLEEPPALSEMKPGSRRPGWFIFPLSARTEEQLTEKVRLFGHWLDSGDSDQALHDIAYTLCTGRDHFQNRLAFIACDREHLRRLVGEAACGPLAAAQNRLYAPGTPPARTADDLEPAMAMVRSYLAGEEVRWAGFFDGQPGRRVSLPTYPFSKDRFTHPLILEPPPAEGQSGMLKSSGTTAPDKRCVPDAACRQTPLVVLARQDGFYTLLKKTIAQDGKTPCPVLVKAGKKFKRLGSAIYQMDPHDEEDYLRLWEELSCPEDSTPTVVHMWNYDCETLDFVYHGDIERVIQQTRKNLTTGPISVERLVRAFARTGSAGQFLNLIYFYHGRDEQMQPHNGMVAGWCRPAHDPLQVRLKCIRTMERMNTHDDLLGILRRELTVEPSRRPLEIQYSGSRRLVMNDAAGACPPESAVIRIRPGGVYLVVDNSRGEAVRLSERLAAKDVYGVVVAGAEPLPVDNEEALVTGSRLRFVSDRGGRADMLACIGKIHQWFGKLDGVIYLLEPWDGQQIERNVDHLLLLDDVTHDIRLDFFTVLAPQDPGQADAPFVSSRFAHGLLELRKWQRRQGRRRGVSRFISCSIENLAVDSGPQAADNAPPRQHAAGFSESAYGTVTNSPSRTADRKAAESLRRVVADMLKVAPAKIDLQAPIDSLNLNSMTIIEICERLNRKLDAKLVPSHFYEHETLGAVSAFLAAEIDADQIAADPIAAEDHTFPEPAPISGRVVSGEKKTLKNSPPSDPRPDTSFNREKHRKTPDAPEAVAIIGISAVLPGSVDVQAFWYHLNQGTDLIRKIPPQRWDRQTHGNGSAIQWGGFIDDADKFDAAFFGISRREAELMDPQQRIFLETAWKAIEDAGYRPSDLGGTATGVFAGVATADYKELVIRHGYEHEGYAATGILQAVLANRISFLLNLRGPSETVDTACSSSLVALCRGVEAICNGQCTMAIAGGVNLILSPGFYTTLHSAGMISRDGRCKVFDQSANGYVRGEGAGVLLLKPLSQAEKDNDHIYAVIKGSAVNHGGRATSLTAPSVAAQAELLIKAYSQAQIDPATVSLIETHGTGTELGDPIEVDALKKAFAELYRRHGHPAPQRPHCGLTTAKTSIGHLEAAAGVAGIIKVLLCMQYGRLPDNIHFKSMNPYINLKNSPFYVVTKSGEWTHLMDENGRSLPRRAGISSFGVGGSNAHIILESHERSFEPAETVPAVQICVLSARNPERLRAYARSLRDFVRQYVSDAKCLPDGEAADRPAKPYGDPLPRLADIAYTLQIGREAMQDRLAIVADSIEALLTKLEDYCSGNRPAEDLFAGCTGDGAPAAGLIHDGPAGRTFIRTLVQNQEFARLAQLWVLGADIDWTLLHPSVKPRRISLPTYPFARDTYWIDTAANPPVARSRASTTEVGNYCLLQNAWENIPLCDDPGSSDTPSALLLFDIDTSLLDQLRPMAGAGQLILIRPGDQFRRAGDGSYRLDPADPENYRRLMADLQRRHLPVERIVLRWSRLHAGMAPDHLADQLSLSVYSVIHLLQALHKQIPLKKVRALFLHNEAAETPHPLYAAVGALARSIHRERGAMILKTVAFSESENPGGPSLSDMARIVRAELEAGDGFQIRYRHGARQRQTLIPLENQPAPDVVNPLRPGGVYLITGGNGALGRILAQFLVRETRAKVVLAGRSALDDEEAGRLKAMGAGGGEVLYLQANVADTRDVGNLINHIRRRFKTLNGIIHCAGLISDAFAHEKTGPEIEAVLAAKVFGTIYLDQHTRDEDLDLFVLFSSLTAVIGNMGQCDYAYANSFMDHFAHWREARRRRGRRKGRTMAVNWPIWQAGNMLPDGPTLQLLEETLGVVPIRTDEGLGHLKTVLSCGTSRIIVAPKHYGAVDGFYLSPPANTSDEPDRAANGRRDEGDLRHHVQHDLRAMVAEILKADADAVDVRESFNQYGFDSISLTELANAVNAAYSLQITPADFFEHTSIDLLAACLIEEHPAQVAARHRMSAPATELSGSLKKPAVDMTPSPEQNRIAAPAAPNPDVGRHDPSDQWTAIIGMAGKMPQSDDLAAYWRHLVEGRDLLAPIPESRWDWTADQPPESWDSNDNGLKWAGLMSDIDQFDAPFFNIKPHEAAFMDPQQRLFLETAWHAIEDAGYRPSSLAGSRTGVFVGVASMDYSEFLRDRRLRFPKGLSYGMFQAIVANRVSYQLDLCGPSEPINTACSSSLVAVHRAAAAIRAGECDLALAGGVHLMLTPTLNVVAMKEGMLSPDGRCRPFDAKANGYVRGEGAGALLLKSFAQAKADGDHIYAVIRGSAVNHGGYANMMSAPSTTAQYEVLLEAYARAGLDPGTLGYIEAHGTGTALGDSIEINAIKKAFQKLLGDRSRHADLRCGIGSVKSNLGHLETAAGMASLFKVLLSMRHHTLPATIHIEQVHPYIDLKDSGLYIVDRTQAWEQPKGSDGSDLPRRAAVSAFGVGGVNAHIVLEEYCPPARAVAPQDQRSQLVVLSARSPEQLKIQARRLLAHIAQSPETAPGCPLEMADMAYTLQTGREEMACRLALPVDDLEELANRLTAYLEADQDAKHIYTGRAPDEPAGEAGDQPGDFNNADSREDERRTLAHMAAHWVAGGRIDWRALQAGRQPRRVPLPGYAFAAHRYWIPRVPGPAHPMIEAPTAGNRRHPFLQIDFSDQRRHTFSSVFKGESYYAADHIIHDRKVVPGAMFLEIAHAAAAAAGANTAARFRNVVWLTPLTLNDRPKQLKTDLMPGAGGWTFEMTTTDDGLQSQTHCRGKVSMASEADRPPAAEQLDLAAIQQECSRHHGADECYRAFDALGIHYGPSFRVISDFWRNSRQALARLHLPDAVIEDRDQLNLHPCLLDGAFQAVLGLVGGLKDGLESAHLPFALGEMDLRRALPETCYAYAQRLPDTEDHDLVKFDIALSDTHGHVVARLKDFVIRSERLSRQQGPPAPASAAASPAASSNAGKMGNMRSHESRHALRVDFQADHPLMTEHLIFDQPILPGVVHISLAVEAVRNPIAGRPLTRISKLLFNTPVKPDSEKGARIIVRIEKDKSRVLFTNHYSTPGSSVTQTAQGELVFEKPPAVEDVDLSRFEDRRVKAFKGQDIYGRLADRRLVYGDDMKTLQSLRQLGSEGIGKLVLTDAMACCEPRLDLHPAILDGAMITGAALAAADEDALFIPFFIKSIDLIHPTDGVHTCHARINRQQAELIDADLSLCDDRGRVAVRLQGVAYKRVRGMETLDQSQADAARAAGPGLPAQAPAAAPDGRAVKDNIRAHLMAKLRSRNQSIGNNLSVHKNFMDAGLASNDLVAFTQEIESEIGIELYPTLLFEYQNVARLSEFLVKEHTPALRRFFGHQNRAAVEGPPEVPLHEQPVVVSAIQEACARTDGVNCRRTRPPAVRGSSSESDSRSRDIAVIGMSGLFADAPDLTAFWDNIRQGRDLIREIPPDHFDFRPWFEADRGVPDKMYCKWGSFISDVDCFDAAFFQIPPNEAKVMDPQLRLLLQVLYHTLEDAGYAGRIRGTDTGMYVGVCFHDYMRELDLQGRAVSPHEGTGNAATMMANRPSYYFDLQGPSLAVDTACSSSLVALHLACRALRHQECGMALVAGTNLVLSPWHYRYFSSIGFLSSAGRCRPFEQRADGYVPGEGVGALLIKPLPRALEDGDRIHAVIKGSAINHSGHAASIVAPNPGRQSQVVRMALQDAGLEADAISYVETQGIGSELADAVEIQALNSAFGQRSKRPACPVGSVKAHIGHTEAAAGIAAVLKVILAMQHGEIPAMPQFEQLNRYIKLDDSPLRINRENEPWQPAGGSPRRAGVSSFGFGGSYAHAILEEYPARPPAAPDIPGPSQLIVLSALTEKNLQALADSLRQFVETDAASTPAVGLADLAYTLQIGREAMPWRLAMVADSPSGLLDKCAWYLGDRTDDRPQGLYHGLAAVPEGPRWLDLPTLFSGEDGFIDALIERRALSKLGMLWVAGVAIQWRRLHGGHLRHLVTLPGYPFTRKRYWALSETTKGNDGFRQKPAAAPRPPQAAAPPADDRQAMVLRLRQLVADMLGLELSAVHGDREMKSYGLDSIMAVKFQYHLEAELGLRLPMAVIGGSRSIEELADAISTIMPAAAEPSPENPDEPDEHHPSSSMEAELNGLAGPDLDAIYLQIVQEAAAMEVEDHED